MKKINKSLLVTLAISMSFIANSFAQTPTSTVNEDLVVSGLFADMEDESGKGFISMYLMADTPVRIVTTTMDTTIVPSKSAWVYDFPISWKGIAGQISDRRFTIYGHLNALDTRDSPLAYSWLEIDNDSLENLFFAGYLDFDIKSAEKLKSLTIKESKRIKDLDLTKLTNLESLLVYGSITETIKLASDKLTEVRVHTNKLSTEAYDDLMCQLPEREGGIFTPLRNTSDENADIFNRTNAKNATDKGWKVRYHLVNGDVPETSGTYVCTSGLDAVESIEFTVYPNPAKDVLYIDGLQNERISIYDIDGRLVKQVISDGKVDIKDLTAGVYAIKIQSTVRKFVIE